MFKALQTERLLIDTWKTTYARYLQMFCKDKDMCVGDMNKAESIEDCAVLISKWCKDPLKYAVLYKEDSSVIGYIFLNSMVGFPNNLDIRFAISCDRRNNGYASEAVMAVCNKLFVKSNIDAVCAKVRYDNKISMNVLDNCHFLADKTFQKFSYTSRNIYYLLCRDSWMNFQKEVTENTLPGLVL